MAHFAKISDGVVESIIVVSDNDCGSEFPASESVGQAFIASLGLNGDWKQTSYNHNFRKQFARVGWTYDSVGDVFVMPQPFPSFTLDSNYDWQAPTSKPEGNFYWDESSLSWLPIPDAG
jgi:hypothetical protein